MLASIIVPVRDDNRIRRCVESVLHQSLSYPCEYEVIVVDNGSQNVNTQQLIAALPITFLVEHRPGICAAVNCGLAHASGDFLVRIDADCVATEHWLEELLKPFSDPAIGAVGGSVYKDQGKRLVEEAGRGLVIGNQLEPQYLPMFGAPYVVTANAAYRMALVKDLGGFDEQFMSGGDVDISWRVSLAGFEIRTAPLAVVYHPTRPTLRKYYMQFYHYGIGHALLFKKYKLITHENFLINIYPFQGIIRLILKDIPSLLLNMLRMGSLDKKRLMRVVLDFTEYIALISGDIIGAIRFRILYF